ncbi:hypothetical protein ANCCEY_10817 [Ancylostoma ceylanicum]|uniref:Uncharacterized protein n=1 Tax=Ancylostoma ceylanicum TaxID=53326 RepID=A0A0D6LJH3_9BILA|nr:hypothetical protein ANCCEY_10817 [Ancylostoma ceylanicum]
MCQCFNLKFFSCPVVERLNFPPKNFSDKKVSSTQLQPNDTRVTTSDKDEPTSNPLKASTGPIVRIPTKGASKLPTISERTISVHYRSSQNISVNVVTTYDIRASTTSDSASNTVSANVTGYDTSQSSQYRSKGNTVLTNYGRKTSPPYVTPKFSTNSVTTEKTRKANHVTTLPYSSHEPKNTEIFTLRERTTSRSSSEGETYRLSSPSTSPNPGVAPKQHTPTASSNLGRTYEPENTETATTCGGSTSESSHQWETLPPSLGRSTSESSHQRETLRPSLSLNSSTAIREYTLVTSSALGGDYELKSTEIAPPYFVNTSRYRSGSQSETYHSTSTFLNSSIAPEKSTMTTSSNIAGINDETVVSTITTKLTSYTVPHYFSIKSALSAKSSSALEPIFATSLAHLHNRTQITDREPKESTLTEDYEKSKIPRHFSQLQTSSSIQSPGTSEKPTDPSNGIVSSGETSDSEVVKGGIASSVVTEHTSRVEKSTSRESYTASAVPTLNNTLHSPAFSKETNLDVALQKSSGVTTVTVTPLLSGGISHTSQNSVTEMASTSREESTRTASATSSLNIAGTRNGTNSPRATYTMSTALVSITSTENMGLLNGSAYSTAIIPVSARLVTTEKYKTIELTERTKRTEVVHSKTYESLPNQQKTLATLAESVAAITTEQPVQISSLNISRGTESSAGTTIGFLIPTESYWSSTPQELRYGNFSTPQTATTTISGASSLTSKTNATDEQKWRGYPTVVQKAKASKMTPGVSLDMNSTTIFKTTYVNSTMTTGLAKLKSHMPTFLLYTSFTFQPGKISSQKHDSFPYTNGSDSLERMTVGSALSTTPSSFLAVLTSTPSSVSSAVDMGFLNGSAYSTAVIPVSSSLVTTEEHKTINLTERTKRAEFVHNKTYGSLPDQRKTLATLAESVAAFTVTKQPVQISSSNTSRETESSAGTVTGFLSPSKPSCSSRPEQLRYRSSSKPRTTTTITLEASPLTSKTNTTEEQQWQEPPTVVRRTEAAGWTSSGSLAMNATTISTKTFVNSMMTTRLAKLKSHMPTFSLDTSFIPQPGEISSQRHNSFPYTNGSDSLERMTWGSARTTTPSSFFAVPTSRNDQLHKEKSTLGGKFFSVSLPKTTASNETSTTSFLKYELESTTQYIARKTEKTVLSTLPKFHDGTTDDEEVSSE